MKRVIRCDLCGAPIEQIKTGDGRNITVDADPVMVIEGDGRENFVTDGGEFIIGRRATSEEERGIKMPKIGRCPLFGIRYNIAFAPHWKACQRRVLRGILDRL